jgi:hypothetical protein
MMRRLFLLVAIAGLIVGIFYEKGSEFADSLYVRRLDSDNLYAFPPPPAIPGPPTITSAVAQQMDYPVKDTITVTIGTADSTENACVKLTWLVSGYPDGVNVGNTMLIADYAPDTSYIIPSHFPENSTIFISIWTGNVSDGDTVWSIEANNTHVYIAEGAWPRYGHKFFIKEMLTGTAEGDSTRVYLATSDFLMTMIEDVSDQYTDTLGFDWIDEWQQMIELHPEMIRLAYVTPPYCSRALNDSMPFWHGFMSQLHSWDENDGVCFYYLNSETASITATTMATDSFIVIDDLEKIISVNSEGLGLGENTGAVRYLHTDGQREVEYILWNGWADDVFQDKDTLLLLNKTDPEDNPRMGTDNVVPKAINDQVTSFQPWGFNIVSVLVVMDSTRPAIDDSVSFEDILADSSYAWMRNQAVYVTQEGDTTGIFNGVYYDLLGEGPIDTVDAANVADTSGINDFLRTQREKFPDSLYYFGGNSQQVDDINMSTMSEFDAITSGEMDRPQRFSGTHFERDNLLQELHSALIAKRIYQEEGSGYHPFTIIWDDHGGASDSADWDRDTTSVAWHRMMLGLATIYDGIHSVKKGSYFFDDQNCWMDEYAVDSAGNATSIMDTISAGQWRFKDNWSTLKYWLGAPTGLIVTQGQELTTPNLISNPSFEDDTTSWRAQNVIVAVDDAHSTDSTHSVRLVPDDETSAARFYQSGVALTTDTLYTFSFDMKSSSNRELHFVIARLGPVVTLIDHDKIAVGKAWTTYASTFHTQGDTSSNYNFGFNVEGQEDTVWIDNCKLQKGQGFYGYSRKYLNGWIGVNLTGGSKVFTVPDTVYKKIDGFVDSVHNDGSSVGTTLTIGGMDAYFLFEPD